VFRHVLGSLSTLDIAGCDSATAAAWCVRAGEGLLNDRLNRARDTGAITAAWCAGERQSIPSLRHVPHPVLDNVIERRTDLCP
jgi:hypothetical protein